MQNILVIFGGHTAEHEVSIITGLQVIENIDTDKYQPLPIYIENDGTWQYMPNLTSRHEFFSASRHVVTVGRDKQSAYIRTSGLLGKKHVVDGAYLALHGGTGEGGPVQGLLETFQIPFTSSGVEGSVVMMNKALSREALAAYNLPIVPGLHLRSSEIIRDSHTATQQVIKKLELPVIVKPAHLGSSIGISIANEEVELEKALISASHMDTEVVVEKLLSDFVEYNISIKQVESKLITSEIERPLRGDEILSFADKYERGGAKKTADDSAGMASLSRELPAEIDTEIAESIRNTAKSAYIACRCQGMLRIDFMLGSKQELYITELNSIPGSMAYYLWEASGIDFKSQISEAIAQSFRDQEFWLNQDLDYKSDIVSKFVGSNPADQ